MTHEPRLSGEKVCCKCLKSKHVLYFATSKNSLDGLHNECRDCARERSKESWRDKKSKKPDKKFKNIPI